jgi:hypothetical protein
MSLDTEPAHCCPRVYQRVHQILNNETLYARVWTSVNKLPALVATTTTTTTTTNTISRIIEEEKKEGVEEKEEDEKVMAARPVTRSANVNAVVKEVTTEEMAIETQALAIIGDRVKQLYYSYAME